MFPNRGDYEIENWNAEFWKLKEEIVGVKAPVERTEADLDPPSLFHICQDYDMIRYFVRTILQFQFAEALCDISGHDGPLHRCDFSGKAFKIVSRLALKNAMYCHLKSYSCTSSGTKILPESQNWQYPSITASTGITL